MLISIITVNLNNDRGLERTIKSVIQQSHQDFEYLIVDGASNDNSIAIIKQYADSIAYWVSEKDSGIYNAMNKGIIQAKGDYCLFLNSGDTFYSSDSLKKFFNGNYNQDIVVGKLLIKQSDNTNSNDIFEIPDNLTANFLFNNYIPHPSTFIKRELLINLGCYDENFKIVSDWVFFLKALIVSNASWVKIDEVISTFLTDGLSSHPENRTIIEEEKVRVLSNLFPLLVEDYKMLNSFIKEQSDYDNYLKNKAIFFLFRIKLIPLLVLISKLSLRIKRIFA